MAITLPTPLRVAAGIVASGIDLVRSLPEEISALPVTLVGKAMQLSMKVQQEIADLATKGDELLSGVLGGPQENPPWARFDDEPPSAAVAAGSRQRDSAGPAMPGGAGSARAGAALAGTAAAAAAGTRVAEGGKAPVVTPLARSNRMAPPDADAPATGEGSKPKAAGTKDDKAKQPKQAKQPKEGKRKQEKPQHDRNDAPDASRPKAPGVLHPSAAGTAEHAPADSAGEDAAPAEPATTEPGPTEPAATEPALTEPAPTEPAPTEPTATAHVTAAGTDTDTDTDTEMTGDPGAAEPGSGTVTLETPADAAVPDTGTEPRSGGDLAATGDGGSANGEVAASTTEPAEDPDDGPEALPDYDRMTLAQVRGYLRGLSAQEVQSLLDHEQSGENRAPFLTLLSNRLVTLEHQES